MKCDYCGEQTVLHSRAGRGQYKDYPELQVCPTCWAKWDPKTGKQIKTKKKQRGRTR